MSNHSELFYKKLDDYYSYQSKKKPWNIAELIQVATEITQGKQTTGRKTRRQYYLLSLYDVLEVDGEKFVIKKDKHDEGKYVCMIAYENIFNVVYEAHLNVGHGGRDKMMYNLKSKHYDVARYAIETFLETCEVCQKKKNKSRANLTIKPEIKPIISTSFNSRVQVDLIDFQSCPDNEYRWLLSYQDHLTKFLFLRPLKMKTVNEVANELLKIFLEIGAPSILQSDDDDREFITSVISQLVKILPSLKILHSQESIEKSNQDVENMLRGWMNDYSSKNWSLGCYFIQFQMNTSYNKALGRSSYKALFGVDPNTKSGFSPTNLSINLLHEVKNEVDDDEFNESR